MGIIAANAPQWAWQWSAAHHSTIGVSLGDQHPMLIFMVVMIVSGDTGTTLSAGGLA